MMSGGRQLVCLLLSLALVLPAALPVTGAAEASQVRGVLLDAEGLPATGYQVGLRSESGDFFLSASTGADGHFELTGLPAGNYRLVAFDPEGAEFPVLSEPIALAAGAVERLEVRIASGATPPGRVRPAAAAKRGSLSNWFGGLPIAAKIGIVVVGAFAVYKAVDSDSSPAAPVSPSQP